MLGFLARRKHLFLILLYPLVGLGFVFCETSVTSAVFVMEWPLVDRAIPLVPWMVVPYVAWYGVVAFPFFWLGWRNGPEFKRFCWYIYAGMTSAYVVYLVFPNGQVLRPALETLGPGWADSVLRWIYTHDTSLNVNPSIHVIDTMGVWFALRKDEFLTKLPGFSAILVIVCASIIASTVLIKQHSILDVFGGLVWSGFWGGLLYFLPSRSFRFGRR